MDYILAGMSLLPSDTEPSLPTLLRAARQAYGEAIRRELVAAGHDGIPRNGIFLLGAIARAGAPLSAVIQRLGVSKQAAGQLVDSLVLRGYLVREVDSNDRRHLTVRLSERGVSAAKVARAVRERIDARLERQVGRAWIEHTRATLLALAEGQPVDGVAGDA